MPKQARKDIDTPFIHVNDGFIKDKTNYAVLGKCPQKQKHNIILKI